MSDDPPYGFYNELSPAEVDMYGANLPDLTAIEQWVWEERQNYQWPGTYGLVYWATRFFLWLMRR